MKTSRNFCPHRFFIFNFYFEICLRKLKKKILNYTIAQVLANKMVFGQRKSNNRYKTLQGGDFSIEKSPLRNEVPSWRLPTRNVKNVFLNNFVDLCYSNFEHAKCSISFSTFQKENCYLILNLYSSAKENFNLCLFANADQLCERNGFLNS